MSALADLILAELPVHLHESLADYVTEAAEELTVDQIVRALEKDAGRDAIVFALGGWDVMP